MCEKKDVILESVSKVYQSGGTRIVVFEDISYRFQSGEVTVILGPSGCGKTTLLRLIAGLEEPTSGEIRISGSSHSVGMVFQEYTAFPWLTVTRNIEFGLRHTGLPHQEHAKIVDYWLGRVGLKDFKNSYPAELSGGMRQRLAIARCLAPSPSVVLLDEPFGSLDAITRLEMGTFTRKLLMDLRVTVLLVTHSVREAVRLGDRVLLLSKRPFRIIKEIMDARKSDPSELAETLESTIERSLEIGSPKERHDGR